MNDRLTPSRFMFFAIAIALMMPVVGIVVAEEPALEKRAVEVVKGGEYRDLTFWRKLKLGAAPYVNPGLAKTAAVAYKYDTRIVMKAAGTQKVSQFLEVLNSGVVVFAICDNDSQRCVVLQIQPNISDEKALADQVAESGGKGALVSTSGQLLDIDPLTPVVSWRPQGPVIVGE